MADLPLTYIVNGVRVDPNGATVAEPKAPEPPTQKAAKAPEPPKPELSRAVTK